MAGHGANLREAHRLRRHSKNLQEEFNRAPQKLKAQQNKVARQEEIQREAQDALKRTKVAIHEKEVTLKTTHAQIAKHKKQLNEAAGKKEYDALNAEIAADQKNLARLEDEILTAMSEVEEKTAQLPELEKNVQRARTELAEFERGSAQRLADLKEQLALAQTQLKEVESGFPEDIRPQYERVISAKGEDALSLVQNRNCSACYTAITAQNYNDLMNGMFILCKSCGRIMYLPE
jgi:predicted  nucleic acid-binding Zn-ribbon protein